MINALFEGIILGITLALLIGPTFFALIQTSIKNGFKSGIALAVGISLSDLVCVILAYLGASQLFDNPKNKIIMGIIGGIILIIFGMVNIFQRKPVEEKEITIQAVNFPLTAVKGFFINILNPFVIIFWVGSVAIVSSKYGSPFKNMIAFFSGTLFTAFGTDVLKALIALKIKKLLNPVLLTTVNRLAGIILIVFGISLIYRVIGL
jgi:threonine/homoserine/homoserine lactone efflux protein